MAAAFVAPFAPKDSAERRAFVEECVAPIMNRFLASLLMLLSACAAPGHEVGSDPPRFPQPSPHPGVRFELVALENPSSRFPHAYCLLVNETERTFWYEVVAPGSARRGVEHWRRGAWSPSRIDLVSCLGPIETEATTLGPKQAQLLQTFAGTVQDDSWIRQRLRLYEDPNFEISHLAGEENADALISTGAVRTSEVPEAGDGLFRWWSRGSRRPAATRSVPEADGVVAGSAEDPGLHPELHLR